MPKQKSIISLKEIIANLPGRVYWKDTDGVYLGSNIRQAHDAGFSIEELIGKTDYDMPWNEQAEAVRENDQRIMRQGIAETVEEFEYLSRKIPLRNVEGEVIGILGVSIEIDDYRRAIEKNRQTLEEIVAVMPGHVYWKNRECILEGCNNQQAIDAGLSSRHEIVGKTAYDLIWQGQPEKDKREQAAITDRIDKEIMATDLARTQEETVVLPNGKKAIYLSKKVPLHNRDNEVTGLVGISFDITRKHEETLLNEAKAEIAAQLAHDIRSPLLILNNEAQKLVNIPEESRVAIKSVVDRINGIANSLLAENIYKEDAHENHQEPIAIMLEYLVSEKQMELDGEQIEVSFRCVNAFDTFADLWPLQFYRVFTSLIDNAVQAIKGQGNVEVLVKRNNTHAIITITDNGVGIPEENLAKIFDKRASFNKEGGTGLGLYAAAKAFAEWGSRYHVKSKVGEGTCFTVEIPLTQQPIWFCSEVFIPTKGSIVILDDDKFSHDTLTARIQHLLGEKASDLDFFHFKTPIELENYCQNNDTSHSLFFLDNHLVGFKETGLLLAEKLNIQQQSTLVTSNYDNEKIQAKCTELKMKLLPKKYASQVPISFVNLSADVVLVEDNELISDLWAMQALVAEKALELFSDPFEFIKFIGMFSSQTTFFFDSDLGNDISGEQLAKLAYDAGHREIYLATGYDSEKFKDCCWLSGVVGKEPPF